MILSPRLNPKRMKFNLNFRCNGQKIKGSHMPPYFSCLHFFCNSKASVVLICWIKRRLIGPSWEQNLDILECKLFIGPCYPYLVQGLIYQQFLAMWVIEVKMKGILSLHYNLLLYLVPSTIGVWGTKIWSRLHVTLRFKIIFLIRVWLSRVLPSTSNYDL
jgi:hypothetical protein